MQVTPLLPMLILSLVSSCIVSEDRAQEKFDKFVEARKGCTADDECMSRHFGCPLGCQTVFNRKHETDIEEKAKRLISRYEFAGRSCEYKCVESAEPVCDAGTCSLR